MKYKFPAIIPAAFNRVYTWIMVRWFRIRSVALCKLWGIKAGRHVYFYGKTYIRTKGYGITIGDKVRFNSFRRLNFVGLTNPTIVDNSAGGNIEIGFNSGFSSVVISSRESINIGNRVLVGGNARIFDHDFHSTDFRIRNTKGDFANVKSRPIVIEDDCFIGTNALILKGTHLGRGTIVAAGSVVFGLHTPPGAVVKGNPASIVRYNH